MFKGILFVHYQVGTHKENGQSDDANFKDILSSVKFVVEILKSKRQ